MGTGEAPDSLRLKPSRERKFPNLIREGYRVTSPDEWVYNCVAHAADRTDARWWPTADEVEGVFWPESVPRDETIEAFILVFGTLGYTPCGDSILETGFETIAIYVDLNGVPCHVARQLTSGRWTSKLGGWEDIEHDTLTAVESSDYGKATHFLKRSRTAGSS